MEEVLNQKIAELKERVTQLVVDVRSLEKDVESVNRFEEWKQYCKFKDIILKRTLQFQKELVKEYGIDLHLEVIYE